MFDLNSLVWVKLPDDRFFLKIKETLTRIGVASKHDKTLYQSCHILHKQGRYAIMHFKELFALDGKDTNFSEEDKARRNTIANLLVEWGLLTLEDPGKTSEPVISMGLLKVITYAEKSEWQLVSKYTVGKKKFKPE